jgi:membrane protein CcdC involved in cytochrome C biogenesis
MLLVAAVGAIFAWSWLLEYALIVPWAVWLIVSARLVVYRQLGSGSSSSDRRLPVALIVPVLLAAAIQPTRYSGLVVVVAFAVLFIFGRHRDGQISATIETP